jgi:hypothetical protein
MDGPDQSRWGHTTATVYHEKSAIRVLNSFPATKVRQTRQRPSLYDEAARGTIPVAASDGVGEFRSLRVRHFGLHDVSL